MDDGKNIERLSLVLCGHSALQSLTDDDRYLMEALDLGREDAVDIDGDAKLGFHNIGKSSLVLLLNRTEGLAELLIFSHRQQVGELLALNEPVIAAKGVSDKSRELWVALQDPSARSNTVRDVAEEIPSLKFNEVAEDRGLEQL